MAPPLYVLIIQTCKMLHNGENSGARKPRARDTCEGLVNRDLSLCQGKRRESQGMASLQQDGVYKSLCKHPGTAPPKSRSSQAVPAVKMEVCRKWRVPPTSVGAIKNEKEIQTGNIRDLFFYVNPDSNCQFFSIFCHTSTFQGA